MKPAPKKLAPDAVTGPRSSKTSRYLVLSLLIHLCLVWLVLQTGATQQELPEQESIAIELAPAPKAPPVQAIVPPPPPTFKRPPPPEAPKRHPAAQRKVSKRANKRQRGGAKRRPPRPPTASAAKKTYSSPSSKRPKVETMAASLPFPM